jgi:hypothetical protein
MENPKIFPDHLYLSNICIGVGVIVLYVILYGIGVELAISNHLLAAGLACRVLCLGSALYFTYLIMMNRASRPIISTRRQY